MTFEEYLISKKIDGALFQKMQPERYQEWAELFEHLHPDSFTMQKKFLINDIRNLYLLKEDQN